MLVKMVEAIVTDRDGRVVKRVAVNEDLFNYVLERVKGNPLDLATVWFIRIMRGIFAPVTAGGGWGEGFVDIDGVGRGQWIKGNLEGRSIFWETYVCNNRLWISYGSSSVAPTRTDYKLGDKLGEGLAGVSIDETQGTLTISASFTMAMDTVIYEVGLEWEVAVSDCCICGRVLLDRTVFPDGITVLAGQTVTFVYRFFFP